MDKLQELINTLSKEDKREFKIFIQRQKNKNNRKDFDLFELLSKEIPTEEVQQILYQGKNKDAYHTLRKRLLRHLTDFIVLKQIDNDNTAISSIGGLISLANYLFNKHSDELAWKFLIKAEQSAIENEQFNLLNNIYQLQIVKSESEFCPGLEGIYKKWDQNKLLANENERANIAYGFIKKELNEMKLEGKEGNIEGTINQILKTHQLKNLVSLRPSMLYKVLDVTRKVMFSKKDFYSFEPYIIKKYNEFSALKKFSKRNYFYKINVLYMIAHVLYRNRKFKESNTYLNQVKECMEEYNRAYFYQFLPKYTLLKAANHSYIGNNPTSIEILKNIEESELKKMPITEQLNIQLNLCVYYFNESLFKEGNSVFQNIGHSDKWLEKKMGKEWVLKKNLIEIVIQYELGNIDIVLNRIRAFERSFSHLFNHPIYQRVATFLKVIKTLIDHPNKIESEDFQNEIYNQIITTPKEQEDLQAIAFYAWLKSKMIKQNYYTVLLDVVNQKN